MKILINKEEIDYSEGRPQSEILSDIAQFIAQNNLTVVDQKVDGVSFNGDLASISAQFGDISLLELDVTTPENLVVESMYTARNYIPQLIENISTVVVLFQEGRDSEGIELFTSLIEGLEWFLSLIHGIQYYSKVGDGEFKQKVDDFNEALKVLVQALENKDMVLISDVLDYEIIPLIQNILEEIEMIIAHQEKELA